MRKTTAVEVSGSEARFMVSRVGLHAGVRMPNSIYLTRLVFSSSSHALRHSLSRYYQVVRLLDSCIRHLNSQRFSN